MACHVRLAHRGYGPLQVTSRCVVSPRVALPRVASRRVASRRVALRCVALRCGDRLLLTLFGAAGCAATAFTAVTARGDHYLSALSADRSTVLYRAALLRYMLTVWFVLTRPCSVVELRAYPLMQVVARRPFWCSQYQLPALRPPQNLVLGRRA